MFDIGSIMSNSSKQRPLDMVLSILVHVMSLVVYAIPVLYAVKYHDGRPVLDEAHIVTDNNADVNGRSSWEELWRNDYWGRSMNADSSHKSWRPFSVASFRIFATLVEQHQQLRLHRVINIVIHAAAAEMVGSASLLFFSKEHNCPSLLKLISKLLFALHPSHVECVVNAANRPHILALLFSLLCIDSDTPYILTVLSWVCGLLSSETFLFQLPAVLLSLTLVQYNKLKTNTHQNEQLWKRIILTLFPRYIILTITSFAYLIYRHLNNWLSIPEGLIRPAENPFYTMTGIRRILNFSYILSLHIFKSLGLDLIGYSHEYGFDCIAELGTRNGIPTTGGMYEDTRLCLPIFLLIALIWTTITSWNQQRGEGLLKVLVATSWFATLFPVSGFVKVGTFVSDRIVIASTVSTCIFTSHFLLKWIVSFSPPIENDNKGINSERRSNIQKIFILVVVCSFFASKTYFRSLEWMNSKDLILSSLRTCPRSIKSHLEMSKIHQGLYPEMLDLKKGLYHLEVAEKIDPEFCDLHQQFAFIHLRQNDVIKFEERMTQCLLCPFTMSGCMSMWNQYWQTTLRQNQLLPEDQRNIIQNRYNKYMLIVNEAVQKEQQKEKLKARKNGESFSDEL